MHVEHCLRIKDELINDVLPLIPSHGPARVRQPARTNLQQLCIKIGCSIEYQLGAKDKW